MIMSTFWACMALRRRVICEAIDESPFLKVSRPTIFPPLIGNIQSNPAQTDLSYSIESSSRT